MVDDPASLAGLPRELLSRVVDALDWTALARLACTARQFRQTCAEVQAAPVWRTQLTDDEPAMDECDLPVQVGELLDELRFPARPDLCLVVASSDWREAAVSGAHGGIDLLHAALRAQLPASCSIVCCYSSCVIGRNGAAAPLEFDDQGSALSISLIHLPPGAALRIAYYQNAPGKRAGAWLKGLPDDSHALLLMAYDGQGLSRWEEALHEHAPAATVVGGALDEPRMSLSLAAGHAPPGSRSKPLQHLTAKSLLLAFSGPSVDMCSLTVRGITPAEESHLCHRLESVTEEANGGISPCVLATDASRGRLERLPPPQTGWRFVPRPSQPPTPAQRLADLATHAADSREIAAMRPDTDGAYSSVFLTCMHQTGTEEQEEAGQPQEVSEVAIDAWPQVSLPAGTVLTQATLTQEQNRLDLYAALAQAHAQLSPLPPGQAAALGCFMTPCNGRGESLYGDPHVESRAIDAAFPGIAIAGFFAAGELGPLPLRELAGGIRSKARLQALAFSTALSFVRLRGPAP